MKSKLLALAALTSLSSAAVADTYMSFDYGLMETEFTASWTSYTTEAEPSALYVAVGNEFNENFAIEGQLGLGLSEDNVDDFDDLEVELAKFLSVNFIGLLPVNETLSFYGKAGLTKVEFEDSDKDKYDDVGLSYGLGGKINLSSNVAVSLEYVVLPDAKNDEWNIDIESNSINFGIDFKL
ncbi:MAG: porin family protein [Pseudomonadales bacterium]|nr:porin family protein [Pseudomonadales bacterium]